MLAPTVFGAAAVIFASTAYAFSFAVDTTTPVQCGVVNFEWQGGEPPFSLTIIPAFDYPSNVSIPSAAWSSSSNTGSYNWAVNYPAKTQFVAVMSDATGLGSGGVSELYTVGTSSDTSCTLRSTTTDFFFYLNETSVQQCEPLQIYWDTTATDPVNIVGAIPGGQPFVYSSTASTNLNWRINIAAGTQFLLGAFDAGKNGQGGSSNLLTVGGSSDTSCLDDSSPSSTPASAGPTSTGTKTGAGVKTVTAITTELPDGGHNLSTGTIVGIVVAAVIVVLTVQGFLLYFCCRRQLAALLSHRKQMRGREIKRDGPVDLYEPSPAGHQNSISPSDHPSLAETGGGGSNNRLSRFSLAGRSVLGAGATSSGRGAAGGGGGETEGYDMASSVSPYWDGAVLPPHSSPTDAHHPFTRGPFDTPPEDENEREHLDLHPPARPHLRTDSLGSTGTGTSPSLSHFSPTNPLLPPSSSSASTGRWTKAQIAAGLDDNTNRGGSGGGERGRGGDLGEMQRLPPLHIPRGGLMEHEDAGPVAREEGEEGDGDEMEELPPRYRPEWEGSIRDGR